MATTGSKTKHEHTMLVATELTTEDMLELFIELSKKLAYRLEGMEKDRDIWKGAYEMYQSAWVRELGGYAKYQHKHQIDALVISTREMREKAVQWDRQETMLLNKDPFWNVPEPEIPKTDVSS